MNAAHKQGRIRNRLRRIARRLQQLTTSKTIEIRKAQETDREPALFHILAHTNRLEARQHSLMLEQRGLT